MLINMVIGLHITNNSLLHDCAIYRIGTIYEDVTTDILGKIGPWQWLVTVLSAAYMVNNMFDATGDMNLLRPVNYEATKGLKCASAAGFNSTLCYSTNGTACEKWHVKLLGIFWVKRSVSSYFNIFIGN